MQIQLSDHFTYRKLLRFTLPSIAMMIFPLVWGIGGIWFSVVFAEGAALLLGIACLAAKRKRYGY